MYIFWLFNKPPPKAAKETELFVPFSGIPGRKIRNDYVLTLREFLVK